MKNKILAKIEEWSAKDPSKIAIKASDGRTLSYQDLINAAKNVAAYIQKEKLDQTGYIAVFLPQSYELSICLLAIWMAGLAYLPLDPIYPQARITEILNTVDLSAVLTIGPYQSLLQNIGIHSICVEELLLHKGLPVQSKESSTAYVIFTSGSTGKPKGVVISHESVYNLLQSFEKKLCVRPEDRLLSITPTSFDIFALELFLPLVCGATCYLTDRTTSLDPELLLTHLTSNLITIFQATPSTYLLLLEEHWPKLLLRHLLCGGEFWDSKLAAQLLQKMPSHCTLWNVYGPTETTIWSSLYQVRTENDIYITPSVDHTAFYVLDEKLGPAEEGELYIAGLGLAIGYYKDDPFTKDRFIKNPFDSPFKRLYKTGDIVRYISQEKFQFVGRSDQQVKIRGFRVELGDIEQTLLKHPSIARVAVFYDYIRYADEKSLIACIESKDPEFTYQKYREFLSAYLPSYMVPGHFIKFDALPLTAHLKVDRQTILTNVKSLFSNVHVN